MKTPKDLAGKRVATSGIPYQSAYLKTILEQAGVDASSVQEINVGFNLTQAMISERADASLGSFWNYEGVDLQRRDLDPVILRMEEIGVPTYNELIFVARRQDLDAAGASRLRRFLSATAAGHRLLRENPQAGVDALLKADKGLDAEPAGGGDQGDAARLLPGAEDRAGPCGAQHDGAHRRTRTCRGAGRSRSTGPPTSAGCARRTCSRGRPRRRAR